MSSPSDAHLDKALAYAALGRAVFPLLPGLKVPFEGSHGFKDATTDTEKIQKWWTTNPSANIGIATGTPSKVFVVDVDVKNDDGFQSLRALEQEHAPLPTTYTVQTPNNGRHYYFRMQGDIRNSASTRLGPGIDIRGNGGYVVAPPSVVGGSNYRVVNSASPAEAPPWLLERLNRSQPLSMQTNDLHSASLRTLHPLHNTDTNSLEEQILAKVAFRTQTLRALEAEEGAKLVKLYQDLVEGRYQAQPGARNHFITQAVPFLYHAVSPRLVLVLVLCFYDCNRGLFKDSRQQHMNETEAMLASVAQTYPESLSSVERQIYDALPISDQNPFRICRDMARLSGGEGDPFKFFMSFGQLGMRLGIAPPQAQRIMKRLADYCILELVEKGTRRSPGVRGKAGVYKWLLPMPTTK